MFNIDDAWRLSPQVAVRPERFGALLYDFSTRRLSFLKDVALLDIVKGLAEAPSARAACDKVGVADVRPYEKALARLAETGIIERTAA